jgi:hypothetical protein
LEPSTTEEDSKRKLLERVSMILMMKKVCSSNVVSVVAQVVDSAGFNKVLIVNVNAE